MGIFNNLKTVFKSKKDDTKYHEGLSKTRESFFSKLFNLQNKYEKINEDYLEQLEEILISADIGVSTVLKLMKVLREQIRNDKLSDPQEISKVLKIKLKELYLQSGNNDIDIKLEQKPSVILFVGVNGVGKTTTLAKIAHKLKDNQKILLVAGDTFRAGAVKQLETWSKRVNVDFYGNENSQDPSSVIFDALDKAQKENYDIVLIDTAGRLQNKDNLMRELDKINRTINKKLGYSCSETLLVIDAQTGQNGVIQAEEFNKITKLSGIVLTKVDGSAKGGIVIAIKDKISVPVKFIGFGEQIDDLVEFDLDNYISELI